MIKYWIDDIRPAPEGYIRICSVNEFKNCISPHLPDRGEVFLLDIDHDAGDWAFDGGDYIKILDYMEEVAAEYGCRIQVHIHSMNPVGIQKMRTIIRHNGWQEI